MIGLFKFRSAIYRYQNLEIGQFPKVFFNKNRLTLEDNLECMYKIIFLSLCLRERPYRVINYQIAFVYCFVPCDYIRDTYLCLY